MPATIKIPSEFIAIDKFSSVIKKMIGGTRKFTSVGVAGIKRFDTKVTRTFNKIGRLSKLALGIGLGSLFVLAADGVRTYEEGLVGVAKTTGIAGKPLDVLGDKILDTSKKLRGIGTDKLLELGQSAGQLGVTGSKNILAFSTTLAKLEKASDIQGEQGAARIARLLTITGEGVGIVDKFSSSLVALGNANAASESEILGVASEVARATAAYGLQSKQILGISTALKALDVRPEAAGTAVGKVFRGIEKATIKGGKTLAAYSKVMGLSIKETKQLFASDSQAAFSLLIKGLNDINNKGGSVQATLGKLGLSGETVSKGIIPLAANYGLLEKTLNESNTEFAKNTALTNEYDAATKTINTALKDLRDEFNNVTIKAATSGSSLGFVRDTLFFLADNMETVVGIGASLIGMYVLMKSILITTQALTWGYNVALGIQGALSGKASIAIGKNVVAMGAYKVAMAIGTAATWLATAAQTAFAFAVNAGLWPILAVIAAIVAIILIFKNWSKITDWFSVKWKQFTSFLGKMWQGVVNWFQKFSFTDFFRTIGQSILKFMLMPLKGILTLLSKIPGKIGKVASFGLEKIGDLTGENEQKAIEENKPIDSPELNSAKITQETIQRNVLGVEINDPGNNVKNTKMEGPMEIPVLVTPTSGAG